MDISLRIYAYNNCCYSGHFFEYLNAWIDPKIICVISLREPRTCEWIYSIAFDIRNYVIEYASELHCLIQFRPEFTTFHCVRSYSMFSFICLFAIHWINSKRCSPVQCIQLYTWHRIQFVYIDSVYMLKWILKCCTASHVKIDLYSLFCNLRNSPENFCFQ